MKLLVAMKGERKGDFCYCDGEIVFRNCVCSKTKLRPCNCRSFVGILSGTHTTTAYVRDIQITTDELMKLFMECWIRIGFHKDDIDDHFLEDQIQECLYDTSSRSTGDIVFLRRGSIKERQLN